MLNGAAPSFEIDGGAALVLLRALTTGALLWVFGASLFVWFVFPRAFSRLPPATAAALGTRLSRLIGGGLIAAAIALTLWLAAQTAVFADADSVGAALGALPKVLFHTRFGWVVVLQLLALVATALFVRRPAGAAIASGVALALGAGHSHALSMQSGPSLLLGAETVHLLAAGAWLGGLIPLLVAVRMVPAREGAMAARWFSPIGKLAVSAIALTALYQGVVDVGSVSGLLGTAYGWMALCKLALFGVLFGFAWVNRYRFAPALLRGDAASSKRTLIVSIALQSAFGALIVLVAAFLATLPPGMHTEPVWPFTMRFSLATVREAPEFRDEVMGAVLALLGAIAIIVLGQFMQRWTRWLGYAMAAIITFYAIPHLDVLLAPAYPTSFETSPTGFSATSIVRGEALYGSNCASCHGADGRGDGPAAPGLAVPPADLTAPHLWEHSDGELAWWIGQGMPGPDNRPVMPGFEGKLDVDERWSVIDFIRARNAGIHFRDTGEWPVPVAAPGFSMACRTGPGTLDALRGSAVLLLLDGPVPSDIPPGLRVVEAGEAQPKAGLCVSDDPAVPQAYRILAGLSAGQNASFLIDREGSLRYASRAGWSDPAALGRLVRLLDKQATGASAMVHPHHHTM
ncbi:MAG: CopD family protein [Acetobacteraceae bacterium]|nr:CopD family protein [Acetobacteraceae bacterium]